MDERKREKNDPENAREFLPKGSPPAFLRIEHLCTGYGSNRVLKDITFQAGSGTLTGLLGANGCGKTTLFRALCHQLPYTGSCICGGQSLTALSGRKLARQISYIPQRTGISISLPVLEVVLMGFNPRLGLLQNPTKAQEAQALWALSSVGMEGFAGKDYQRLSEGQKQLCILARTVVEDAPLLLLDEPESALDFAHRYRVMRLLREMVGGTPDTGPADGSEPRGPGLAAGRASDDGSSDGSPENGAPDSSSGTSRGSVSAKAALVALHDPALALEYCQQLVLLKDGVCTDILRPASDAIPRMERALSDIYGPVRLKDFADNGRRRLVILPE